MSYCKHKRQRPLCREHVERNLVMPHTTVGIAGMGSLCEWCQEEGRETPADFLVDLRVGGAA